MGKSERESIGIKKEDIVQDKVLQYKIEQRVNQKIRRWNTIQNYLENCEYMKARVKQEIFREVLKNKKPYK